MLGQSATAGDPYAQIRGEREKGEHLLDADEALIQNVQQADKKTVYETLALELRMAEKRGAVPADDAIQQIDQRTRSNMEEKAKTLNETDKTKLTQTTKDVMGKFLQTDLIRRLTGHGYTMMNLEAYQASGLYRPGEEKIYIDYKNLSPDAVFSHLLFRNPNKYAEHVCDHEDFHKLNQAKVMNAPLLRVPQSASELTFKIQPDLVEGQASAKKNQDNELVPDYKRYKSLYLQASAIIGQQELDAAIKSGDIMSLQEAINEKFQSQGERRAA